jgi:hypothetical protein
VKEAANYFDELEMLTRRRLIYLIAAACFALGAVLCPLKFGTMFWGNWLHSASFHVGLVAVSAGIALLVAGYTASWTVGIAVFGVLLVLDAFLFWTFPGWLMLHHLIDTNI